MNIVYKMGTGEVIEKKSKFIAHVFHIKDEDEALVYINEVKKKYWDARHHCYAYVLGSNNEIQKCSDDGEPSGTAGKPIMEVIMNRMITDCLIVVTRYFGGTLLGTGGLIRAYQAASSAGVDNSLIAQVKEGIKGTMIVDYSTIGKLQYLCAEKNAVIYSTEFAENVNICIIVEKHTYDSFIKQIADTFAGRLSFEHLENILYINSENGVEIL